MGTKQILLNMVAHDAQRIVDAANRKNGKSLPLGIAKKVASDCADTLTEALALGDAAIIEEARRNLDAAMELSPTFKDANGKKEWVRPGKNGGG
jgi:hypothetical protein